MGGPRAGGQTRCTNAHAVVRRTERRLLPSPSDALVAPLRRGSEDGYERLNVASQRHDPDSLLNWMERMIRLRKECHEIGWGAPTRSTPAKDASSRHRFDWEGRALLFAHNLDADHKAIDLADGISDVAQLTDLHTGEDVEPSNGTLSLELDVRLPVVPHLQAVTARRVALDVG